LKNAGLIKGSIEGNAICYCIDETCLEKIMTYFSAMAAQLKSKNCC
jgi:hypothetical protein